MSNVKKPFNPHDLAKAWPKVEQSITEAEAIDRYLAGIRGPKTPKPDPFKDDGRRFK